MLRLHSRYHKQFSLIILRDRCKLIRIRFFFLFFLREIKRKNVQFIYQGKLILKSKRIRVLEKYCTFNKTLRMLLAKLIKFATIVATSFFFFYSFFFALFALISLQIIMRLYEETSSFCILLLLDPVTFVSSRIRPELFLNCLYLLFAKFGNIQENVSSIK